MGFGDRDYYKPSGFGGFSFFPPVIKNLLIINGVVFLIQMILDNLIFGNATGGYIINRYLALNPIVGADDYGNPFNFQIWQLITYQFLHGNFSHILFNMFALWMFGMEIENLMGSKKFLIFYLAAGVIGGAIQVLVSPFLGGADPTIGASGSVYAVLVAFALFFPDRYIFIYFLLPIKAKYLIAGYMVMAFMSVGDASVIAHLVHIGGALSGLIFVLMDRRKNFNFDKMFNSVKNKMNSAQNSSPFRKGTGRFSGNKVEDADYYEINDSSHSEEGTQEEIDKILDKISQSGYQNLTAREKRILFEASKKK